MRMFTQQPWTARVKRATAAAGVVATAAFLAVTCVPNIAAAADTVSRALDDALMAIAMTRDDLHFRTDYADAPDSFRLTVADSLLEHPLHTEPYVRGLADDVSSPLGTAELVVVAAKELDLTVWPEECPGIGPEGADALGVLLPAFARAREEIAHAFAGLTDEERAFLVEHAPVLLEEEEFDPEKPIDVREQEADEAEALGDRLLVIAGAVDFERIAAAGAIVAEAVDASLAVASDLRDQHGPATGGDRYSERLGPESIAWGDVIEVRQTEQGIVVIGGTGTTYYGRGAALIIDLGGNDVYDCRADADRPIGAVTRSSTGRPADADRPLDGSDRMHPVGGAVPSDPIAVVIDLEGDDVYLGGHHCFGSGFMGVGIVADLAGDDRYVAGSFSLGSGLFGVGVLRDAAGHDTYEGDTCVQGAGAFGIGILLDEDGNDTYRAAVFSQAFGFVKGFGLLDDLSGNDSYYAGGKYTDEIRYFDHSISLSQGFGFGWRPDASGGIGMLVDGAGNDVYVSDIFGQGSSYWFSVGGLVDVAGNDQYISYQYAQGAGTHITVAALIDYEGDDNYVSKGVSQGCGHDLAIGILHDLAGDDNYTCHDLSQAAGNANGIGLLIDDAGNDAYTLRDRNNTHGYGNLRRDYGSIGVFLDCGGTDSYAGRGADDTWWSYSDHGIGVDTELAADAANGGTAE